jgi:hypothetical protein
LRAKRSNPGFSARYLDCFVAFAPRNEGELPDAPHRRRRNQDGLAEPLSA